MGPEPDLSSHIPGMHIWGWMTEVELLWLGYQAAQMESVAEIGSLHGRSAFMLLSACKGSVYCVDPWNDEADRCYGSFMEANGDFENLVAIRDRSPLANPPQVDMTFIDGAHSYPSVLADIAGWLPVTWKLICGHDYQNADAGYPGVAKAVHQVFGDRVQVAVGTAIWYVDLTEDRTVLPDLPDWVQGVDEYGYEHHHKLSWPR